jgi:hypothetical protein
VHAAGLLNASKDEVADVEGSFLDVAIMIVASGFFYQPLGFTARGR